jgi:hypothetical protein
MSAYTMSEAHALKVQLERDLLIYGNCAGCSKHGRIEPTDIRYDEDGQLVCPKCEEHRSKR